MYYIGFKEDKELHNTVKDGEYFVYKSGVVEICKSKEEVIKKSFEIGGLPYKKVHSSYIDQIHLKLDAVDDGKKITFFTPVGQITVKHFSNSVGIDEEKIVSVWGRIVVFSDDTPMFQFFGVKYADGSSGDCGCSIPESQEHKEFETDTVLCNYFKNSI